MQNDSIRVSLLDSQVLVRSGLRALLEKYPDVRIVAEEADPAQMRRLADRNRTDVILVEPLDSRGQWIPAIEALKSLTGADSAVRVIVLTSADDEELFHAALAANVSGFLRKVIDGKELALAIRLVYAGHRFIHRSACHYHLDTPTRLKPPSCVYKKLTPREREVVTQMVDGLAGPEIAARLHISVRTVESHRANIMRKLKVRNMAELIRAVLPFGEKGLAAP